MSICAPAMKLARSLPDDRPRWCFGCRHHCVHVWELWVTVEPSYWDPYDLLRCQHCRRDQTRFPAEGDLLWGPVLDSGPGEGA